MLGVDGGLFGSTVGCRSTVGVLRKTSLAFVCLYEIMAQHGGNFAVFTLLLSFFAILQFAGFSNSNPTSTNFDERESHSPKALRASQRDQYLLGVGKADITG